MTTSLFGEQAWPDQPILRVQPARTIQRRTAAYKTQNQQTDCDVELEQRSDSKLFLILCSQDIALQGGKTRVLSVNRRVRLHRCRHRVAPSLKARTPQAYSACSRMTVRSMEFAGKYGHILELLSVRTFSGYRRTIFAGSCPMCRML